MKPGAARRFGRRMRAPAPRVQEVYIGSGATECRATARKRRRRPDRLLTVTNVDTFYGKSHILTTSISTLHGNEIIRDSGRTARQVDAPETLIGIASCVERIDSLRNTTDRLFVR